MAAIKYIKVQSLPRVDDPILNRALHTIDGELGKIARVLNNINADNIPDDTITTDHIADDAITADQVANAVIAAEHIAIGAIEEAKIAADAVTATKINVAALNGATGAIVSDHIIAGMLQTDCVTEAKILADAITALKINIADFINLPSDENLVGYWSFDEGSGTLAVDGSGSGNNGTLTNMAEEDWVAGVVGTGLDFAGDDDYVEVADDVSFDFTNKITIAAWIKCSETALYKPVSSRGAGSGNTRDWDIGVVNDDFYFVTSTGIASNSQAVSFASYHDEWVHVTCVYDAGQKRIYFNGTKVAEGTYESNLNQGTGIDIGARRAVYAGLNNWFDGLIDEVRIYSRALTANEIKALYLYPAGNKAVTISGGQIAAATITASELASDCVIEAKVLADAITATKINVSGLDGTSGDVAADHIVAGMIQTNAITSIKILADAVTASKINVVGLDGTTGRIIVADVTDADEITGGINTHATTLIAPGKVLISGEVNLDDWSSATDATYIDGGKIYTDTITATQIDAGTITATELGSNCVTSIKILADAITASKINIVGLDGTTGRIIVADTTDANVVSGGINSYATTLIAPGKVLISGATVLSDWSHGTDATLIDGGEIYTNSITATQIAALTITAAEIASNAITGVKILADAVTATKINVVGLNGATGRIVVTDQTDADEVTAGINTHAVTLINAGKILISGAVPLSDWSHATDATLIDGGEIYTNSITATQIDAGTITTTELNFTPYVIGTNDLDDVSDGTTYAKVLNTDITAGHILLTACTGDLDDIADGSNYGKVALTSITAGKIIVAGLDSGITGRMFTDSTTMTNIEAWKHASDVTMIDGGDIYADSITANQILAGTITASEIHTDTITADNLVTGQRVHWRSVASTTVKNSNNTVQNTLATSYEKLKETLINEGTGSIQVYFEMKSLGGDGVWGRIYKNGAAVGTERLTAQTSYQPYSEGFTSFSAGDLIQVYAYATSGERVYIQNLRFRYTRAVTVVAGQALSNSLETADQTAYSMSHQD